jgi:hypothetical protein
MQILVWPCCRRISTSGSLTARNGLRFQPGFAVAKVGQYPVISIRPTRQELYRTLIVSSTDINGMVGAIILINEYAAVESKRLHPG